MGNIGSGFGNPNVRCGFEDGYFPAHAPLGFPNCANYKGTPEQRIADLIRRGYGSNSDVTNAWRKYYAENPSDPLKIDYTKVGLNAINNSMSKAEALAEQALIGKQKGNPRNYGTWSQRVEQDRKYNANYVKNNIAARTTKIEAVLSNPSNIVRWENEAYAKKLIEIENQRIEKQRLIELENQRIENQRLLELENQRIEEERLLQIQLENKRIVMEKQKPIIEPEIIPAVVASSILIPLAAIGLLLYTTRSKK